MLYLLDANVLIDANRDYYPLERIPEFWEWLQYHGQRGTVSVPPEIFDELEAKKDALSEWLKSSNAKQALIFEEEPNPVLVSRVVAAYAPDLSDDEIEQLGRDPFLIAYALAEPDVRRVVTTETSKPSRIRANRHVPDVCKDLGVTCLTAFRFFQDLDFRTGWKDR
ncbi:MAG: DUF4411 family protein [Gemmatimonadota bacterium]